MKLLLVVFVGGGLGSLMRYGVQFILHERLLNTLFPWGTLGVNLLGSFLIGLFYAWSVRFNMSEEMRLFLATGLCGGFTTFSTFSYENLMLLRQGYYSLFFLYVSASILLGIAAALGGGYIGTMYENK